MEVLGVVHQFRPHQDLILIKTAHPRLEIAHTVAGMSGSPVFLEGKMIRAYVYGWQFGSEAIAGVTPIQSMLDELARPLPILGPFPTPAAMAKPRLGANGEGGGGARAGSFGSAAFAGNPADYDVREHARQLAESGALPQPAGEGRSGADLVPVMTPVLLGGVGERTARVARQLFGPLGLDLVQGGGAGEGRTTRPRPLRRRRRRRRADGRAATSRSWGSARSRTSRATKLCGFGHPMMERGVTALPTAIGRVHWIFASDQQLQDRRSRPRPRRALANDRQSRHRRRREAKNAPIFRSPPRSAASRARQSRTGTSRSRRALHGAGFVASVVGSMPSKRPR